MVEQGMTPMDVLVTATVNAADLIDMSEQLGTLEKNKYADIIATKVSPLDDIKALLNVDFVMRSGETVKAVEGK